MDGGRLGVHAAWQCRVATHANVNHAPRKRMHLWICRGRVSDDSAKSGRLGPILCHNDWFIRCAPLGDSPQCFVLLAPPPHSEFITFSVIVLSGSELKGSITFDGPIDTAKEIPGKRLHEASESYRYNPARKDETLVFGSLVDFEHLNPIKNQKAAETDEEQEEVVSDEESVAERRARRARERKKALEKRQKEQEDMMHQRRAVREEGDPFQKTYKAKTSGWYRFCVTASWNNIDVEIDLRRAEEMGGVGENGHVYTLEEKALAEEENLMEEDTAEKEGVSEEDFKATQDKLKTLRRLLGK